MKIVNPKKILISRTDSIGDVILTLPMAGILKNKFPNAAIIFLGNTYTKPIIKCSEFVDEIIEWTTIEKLSEKEQIEWLKSLNLDVFIHVFANKKLAKLAKKAKIPNRIGTSHRMFHLLTCNNKVGFSRKNSDLHEAQLNIKLLKPLGITRIYSLKELVIYTGFIKISTLKENFQQELNSTKKNIIFHCKSQGSALEWGVDKFITLAQDLNPKEFNIFFTGTEIESKFFRNKLPQQENIIDLSGKMTLEDLVAFISKADLLIAASTGPLHIAGVCNIKTIGLYTPKKPIHSGRWQPLGKNVFIIEEKTESKRDGMLDVSVDEVRNLILSLFNP